MSSSIRDLNIKKNAVVQVMKDISFSDKEIERQKQRIQQYKDDETRDGYDVKKQVHCSLYSCHLASRMASQFCALAPLVERSASGRTAICTISSRRKRCSMST